MWNICSPPRSIGYYVLFSSSIRFFVVVVVVVVVVAVFRFPISLLFSIYLCFCLFSYVIKMGKISFFFVTYNVVYPPLCTLLNHHFNVSSWMVVAGVFFPSVYVC
jgi:hypothetical protein